MPQEAPTWEEIPEFTKIAAQLIEKYQERYVGIEPAWIICYGINNKSRPATKTQIYSVSGEPEPECLTNSKKYFIKMFLEDWEELPPENKTWLVCSVLERIDKDDPASGKVNPLDYKDQGTCVRTLGPDWLYRNNLPDLLKDKVKFYDATAEEITR